MIFDVDTFPGLTSSTLVNESLSLQEARVVLSSPSEFTTIKNLEEVHDLAFSSKLATMTDSYFPSSHRSSVSSGSDFILPDAAERPVQPRTTTESSTSTTTSTTSPMKRNPIDPLSRDYPIPAKEIDLDEMLARPPKKWTLGHYLKETPLRETAPAVQDKEKRALELAAAKKDLLQGWENLHAHNNDRR